MAISVNTPTPPTDNVLNWLVPYQEWWNYGKNSLRGREFELKDIPRANLNNIPDAIVGLEVEIENIKNSGAPIPWLVKDDGSLRDNGWEYITPPMLASYIPARVEQLFAYLNSDIKFSERCSIHVHMNIQDLSPENVYNLSLIYTTVEKLLFKFVGNNRDQSIFCVPLSECVNLAEVFQERNVHHLRFIKLQWMKYCAINYMRMGDIGTIEFRHMHGTRDITKIFQWIMLLLSIRSYAKSAKSQELLYEISMLNTNSEYYGFLQRVFGGLVYLLDTSQLLSDMEYNIARIKAASYYSEIQVEINTKGLLWESYCKFAVNQLKMQGRIILENEPPAPPTPNPEINPVVDGTLDSLIWNTPLTQMVIDDLPVPATLHEDEWQAHEPEEYDDTEEEQP